MDPVGLLTNWNGPSALEKMSNGSFHLDGIIGVDRTDNPLSTGNAGTISREKKGEDLQELIAKLEEQDSNQFVTS